MKQFKTIEIDGIEDFSKSYDQDHQWMVFENNGWNGLNVTATDAKKSNSMFFTEKVVKIKKGEPTFMSESAKNVIESRFPELSFRCMK